MSRRIVLAAILLCSIAHAQEKPKDGLPFCGALFSKKKAIHDHFDTVFHFFNVSEGDTIVDVGAASGWIEGAFAAVTPLRSVHFILLDIDTGCLNARMIGNMQRAYAAVRGEPLPCSFQWVRNSPDSLHLPLNRFRKLWLINVLHEVPEPARLVQQVAAVLQSGGEVVVEEMMPKTKGQLHGGCHKPLMQPDELETVFTANGFLLAERKLFRPNRRQELQLLRFRKP